MPQCLRELSHVASKEKAKTALRPEPRERRFSLGSDRGFGSGFGAICLTAIAKRTGVRLRPYLARCLTAIAKRTGGITQSRICTTVLLLAQKDAWGVRPLRIG
jgi:hypothetical protein